MSKFLKAALLFILLFQLSACSACYLAKASYEEAKIVLGKEKISKVLKNQKTSKELKETLTLVESVREFSSEKKLTPSGSYEDYYDIGRDVLVWVLSAAKKDSLQAHTWWFPIVGRVPYKGYFDKQDGLDYAKYLSEEKGLDFYLRPSPAFSTLGWLNDPFLSTMDSEDKISIVNTLVHEIFHNTLWIKGSVSFNETMANIAGAAGAIEYFEEKEGKNSPLAKEARDRLEDERVYAKYLNKCLKNLEEFYNTPGITDNPNFNEERDKFFEELKTSWNAEKPKLKSDMYKNVGKVKFNNSVLLARKVYYDRYEKFYSLYSLNGKDFSKFLESVLKIQKESKENRLDIWKSLDDKINLS